MDDAAGDELLVLTFPTVAMKLPLLLSLVLAMAAPFCSAVPLAVGAASDDVRFSEGTAFASGRYTSLEPRQLSDYSGKAIVLVYFTPW